VRWDDQALQSAEFLTPVLDDDPLLYEFEDDEEEGGKDEESIADLPRDGE